MEKIKVLIVDDSAFMRKSISLLLNADAQIEVIDTAIDGAMAIEKIKKLKPDIVTLDVEMPRMDGLTALKIIMKECPVPVIMLSSLTTEGASVTMKALELGAVDFISKESSFVSITISSIKEELISKVKEIYKSQALKRRLGRIRNLAGTNSAVPRKTLNKIPVNNYQALGLGISTGGPISLQKVIPKLSNNLKIPVFIVQHMPPKFTASLADRLNALSSLEVKEATNGEVVRNGVVYIAPGGYHLKVRRDNSNNLITDITEQPANVLHRPSVDVMLESLHAVYGKKVLGVIMTGMGKDGLEGIRKIKQSGGYCIAQNEESCVVYGMPRAIAENGLADVIASLEDIPKIINQAI
ncbi:MAG: chemotaxis response regulator protein-glutamate methylesterase [Ignavibacteriae bacterium]|nr:MAG: chemotaxis response regulator protein-glutamate methylesterase [Ignavibacteriota bacterium]